MACEFENGFWFCRDTDGETFAGPFFSRAEAEAWANSNRD
jgi:hypothetical protein